MKYMLMKFVSIFNERPVYFHCIPLPDKKAYVGPIAYACPVGIIAILPVLLIRDRREIGTAGHVYPVSQHIA